MSTLFESIDIWDRRRGEAVRYRCFRVLATGRFCVQSSDFYRLPIDEKQDSSHERNFLELLIEQAPDERDETFASLEEAIAAHNRAFEG
jgi:hypothetical protein